jgi:hypothetical protein
VILLAVLVVCVIGIALGAVGLLVHTLHWLLFLGLIVFVAGLALGLAKRVFQQGWRRGRRTTPNG